MNWKKKGHRHAGDTLEPEDYRRDTVDLWSQEGARVMYLNNRLFEHDVCNGTIGVITKIVDRDNVEVAFPTTDNILKINVQKATSYFNINDIPASRSQFPIQNAFALTVHKTQGLTLTRICSPRVRFTWRWAGLLSWESVDILTFDFDHLKVDEHVIAEYGSVGKWPQNDLEICQH